jgi:streptomycin 6-kinase
VIDHPFDDVDLWEPSPGRDDVWFAVRHGEHVVVKVGDAADRAREAAALGAFSGGSARLLEHRPGALLVERILPGDDVVPVADRDDDAATRHIAQVMVRLHADQVRTRGLPALREIAVAFDAAADGRLPVDLVARARSVCAELLADGGDAVLHGDLQHFNVLRGPRVGGRDTWWAIDPHGWVGDPTFEVAPLLANPRRLPAPVDARGMDGAHLVVLAERRIAIVAEVSGYAVDRLRAWGFVGAVISELWLLDKHDLVHGAPLALAQGLAPHV